MEIFIVTFIILTIMHSIADYMVPLKSRIPWHYLLAINPLHFLWDETFGLIHSKHARHFSNLKEIHFYFIRKIKIIEFNFVKFDERPGEVDLIYPKFWFWLGIDQLAHVILNLSLAIFVEAIL